MEELSYVLTQYFVSCVHVRFYFSLPLIFTLLAANISHFLTAALYFHVFLPVRNSSPLFLITRSSSLSVIHVSVNIKINAEKGTISLLFFLSKSPGGHVISFQIKPWVAFGLFYQRSAIRAKNSDPYQDEVLDPCCESYAQPSAWLSVTGSK